VYEVREVPITGLLQPEISRHRRRFALKPAGECELCCESI
jgi:hypothetical protein